MGFLALLLTLACRAKDEIVDSAFDDYGADSGGSEVDTGGCEGIADETQLTLEAAQVSGSPYIHMGFDLFTRGYNEAEIGYELASTRFIAQGPENSEAITFDAVEANEGNPWGSFLNYQFNPLDHGMVREGVDDQQVDISATLGVTILCAGESYSFRGTSSFSAYWDSSF